LSQLQVIVCLVVLLFLVLFSAFFSIAETGLISVNRYRLRHKARLKKQYAILILRLLKRPDRLLGAILIGNNFSNILASSLATLIAVHFWGDSGVIISTVFLTIVILVFAEVAPKTLAALYPEQVSKIVALPIFILLKVFYPVVWFINALSNGILRLFKINVTARVIEPLSREELRNVVYETTLKSAHQYQNMLLSILDLNKMTVEDVMIPRHEIIGIDLESEWKLIREQISKSPHDWLPVYRENINDMAGILHLREVMRSTLQGDQLTKEGLIATLHEPYFVPCGTLLNVQLLNFQHQKKRIALVVDEYGELQGLVTMDDILQEIVGDFTTSVAASTKMIKVQADGSYLVDGAVTVRDLNRVTHWQLPTRGPRTINGLIVEHLEANPQTGTCVQIAHHPIEILQVDENLVTLARIFPSLKNSEH
jgi:Mg2+/Co2+ transporter CorB